MALRAESVRIFIVLQILVWALYTSFVICEEKSYQGSKKSRFISFETTDDNIKVDLDFSIPFLSIPVKRTLESTIGSSDVLSQFPTVNINLAGIVLGGAVVLGSTFLLPFLLKTIAIDSPGRNNEYGRLLENTEFQGDVILNSINEIMTADKKLLGCIQRFVCWTAKNGSNMMARSQSTKTTDVLNEFASSTFLTSLLNGTVIETAIKTGAEGKNCTTTYDRCPISDDNMKIFMTNLSKLGKL